MQSLAELVVRPSLHTRRAASGRRAAGASGRFTLPDEIVLNKSICYGRFLTYPT